VPGELAPKPAAGVGLLALPAALGGGVPFGAGGGVLAVG
jgi:hypothetical protein